MRHSPNRSPGGEVGRPRTLTPHQRQEAMQRLAEGEVQADLARSYGVRPVNHQPVIG